MKKERGGGGYEGVRERGRERQRERQSEREREREVPCFLFQRYNS